MFFVLLEVMFNTGTITKVENSSTLTQTSVLRDPLPCENSWKIYVYRFEFSSNIFIYLIRSKNIFHVYIINYNMCAIVYTDNRNVAGKISSVHTFVMTCVIQLLMYNGNIYQ